MKASNRPKYQKLEDTSFQNSVNPYISVTTQTVFEEEELPDFQIQAVELRIPCQIRVLKGKSLHVTNYKVFSLQFCQT